MVKEEYYQKFNNSGYFLRLTLRYSGEISDSSGKLQISDRVRIGSGEERTILISFDKNNTMSLAWVYQEPGFQLLVEKGLVNKLDQIPKDIELPPLVQVLLVRAKRIFIDYDK